MRVRAPRGLLALSLTAMIATGPAHVLADQPVLLKEEFAARAGAAAPALRQINCTVKPLRVVELAAPSQGTVAKVHVRPGDQVKVGDLLVELDTTILEAELNVAKARAADLTELNAAKVRRDGLAIKEARLAKASAQRAVSVSQHDAAVLDLALAEAEITQVEQALALAALEVERTKTILDSMQLRSPVAGVVGENLIDPGEAAGQEPVATLYVNQPLRVEAFVPSALISSFAAQDRFDSAIGTPVAQHSLSLDYISPVADLASNTISVFFLLSADSVLPGSKCQIDLATARVQE